MHKTTDIAVLYIAKWIVHRRPITNKGPAKALMEEFTSRGMPVVARGHRSGQVAGQTAVQGSRSRLAGALRVQKDQSDREAILVATADTIHMNTGLLWP